MAGRKAKSEAAAEIELRPDGWERFERAVDAALASAPKHRPTKAPSQIIREIARKIMDFACIAGRASDREWTQSVFLPRHFFEGKRIQGIGAGCSIRRATMPNEFVRINFDVNERMTALAQQLRLNLHAAMPPSLDGLGNLVMKDTPEGVIILRDIGPRVASHEDSPLGSNGIA